MACVRARSLTFASWIYRCVSYCTSLTTFRKIDEIADYTDRLDRFHFLRKFSSHSRESCTQANRCAYKYPHCIRIWMMRGLLLFLPLFVVENKHISNHGRVCHSCKLLKSNHSESETSHSNAFDIANATTTTSTKSGRSLEYSTVHTDVVVCWCCCCRCSTILTRCHWFTVGICVRTDIAIHAARTIM